MTQKPDDSVEAYSTLEVARMLGMAVRSVQLMVDRGELLAWKTPGGHRRISRASVHEWQTTHQSERSSSPPAQAVTASRPRGQPSTAPTAPRGAGSPRVLLIEDSTHYQNLVTLLVRKHLPSIELQVADDGIAGLAMVGQWQPDVLIVDILLPGIDGATLITSLRTSAQFKNSRLIVITSLDEAQRAPYAFALEGLPVIHKPRLAVELPSLLSGLLNDLPSAGTRARSGR
ncbi:MAG: response regulator [Rhizobacter sp.]